MAPTCPVYKSRQNAAMRACQIVEVRRLTGKLWVPPHGLSMACPASPVARARDPAATTESVLSCAGPRVNEARPFPASAEEELLKQVLVPMQYDPSDLKPRERYKVLTSFVLPRPIAWVTTIGPTGVVNAAPFSFFNVFCEDPPLCMFAANARPDGRVKDTVANIARTGEFVVNLADEPLARAMHDSSGDFPPEVGEPDFLGLKLAPSSKVAVPRLADAPWAMECKTWKTIDVNTTRRLIMGEGVNFHIRDELWDPVTMRVNMDRYHPIGRMFADRYCRTDDRVVFPPAEGPSSA